MCHEHHHDTIGEDHHHHDRARPGHCKPAGLAGDRAGDADDWDGQYECQANRTWSATIRVRRHADGRHLVYGCAEHDTHFPHESAYRYYAGRLLGAADTDVAAEIARLADALIARGGRANLIVDARDEVIADLPAQAL